MRTTEEINADLTRAESRLTLYLNQEEKMLSDGVQSYGFGSRNLARYNTELTTIRTTIDRLKQEVRELKLELAGKKPRRAMGVLIRDW